jgi:hypothetical protein
MLLAAAACGAIAAAAALRQSSLPNLPNRCNRSHGKAVWAAAGSPTSDLITQQAPRGRAESAGDSRLQGFLRLPASSADWLRSDLGNHDLGWALMPDLCRWCRLSTGCLADPSDPAATRAAAQGGMPLPATTRCFARRVAAAGPWCRAWLSCGSATCRSLPQPAAGPEQAVGQLDRLGLLTLQRIAARAAQDRDPAFVAARMRFSRWSAVAPAAAAHRRWRN